MSLDWGSRRARTLQTGFARMFVQSDTAPCSLLRRSAVLRGNSHARTVAGTCSNRWKRFAMSRRRGPCAASELRTCPTQGFAPVIVTNPHCALCVRPTRNVQSRDGVRPSDAEFITACCPFVKNLTTYIDANRHRI